MIRVRDLYEMGLNRTVIDPDNPYDVPMEQLAQNVKVFNQSFASLQKHIDRLACGGH